MTIMKITKGLSLAALAVAAIGSGGAYAAQDSTRARIDANGDGAITRAEAQSAATAMFARLDANNDGKLDAADRAAHVQASKGRRFDRIDANKDGQITRAEFLADHRPQHAQGHRGSGGKALEGQRKHHGGRMMAGRMMAMSRMADINNDGSVSQSEFNAAAMKRFDMMDTNKDGRITMEERQAGRERMKAEWQRAGANKSQG